MHHLALAAAVLLSARPTPDPHATAIIDSALARMGGAPALRGLTRVRLELMTQWQRTSFDPRPYADIPVGYERHSELRDYTLPAWRNHRRFAVGDSWQEITDLARDSVAIRRARDAWAPLNVAYVDERRELFTFAPERVLLLARDAADLQVLSDTIVGGSRHARITATVNGFPATLFIRRSDGLPAMVRYLAAQPNDFGLAPWGRMEVEWWYSRWEPGPGGANLPKQWDVRRVGRPYKRTTVLSVALDSTATADSFLVSDSLRAAFLATATRPMYDLPLDSARLIEPRLARFGAFPFPAGAVKLGNGWILLESGQAELNAGRAVGWLQRTDPNGRVAGAVLTIPSGTNGGVVWLAGEQTPIYAGPGVVPFVREMLRNHGRSVPPRTEITTGRWLRIDRDSAWVEPLDLPDAPGSLLLYVPSLDWAYSAGASSPLEQRYLVERLRSHGWRVSRLGSRRELWGRPP